MGRLVLNYHSPDQVTMIIWFVSFFVILQDAASCQPDVERSRRHTDGQQNILTDLHRDLMADYDDDVIPLLNPITKDTRDGSDSLLLNFGMSVINLDMDAKNLLSTTAWLRMSWMDFRLKWDPDMYGGIETVKIPASKLWTPDIEIYTEASYTSRSIKERLSSTLAVIYSSGFVLFIPPLTFQTRCEDSGPVGSFSCTIKAGSWTYDGFHLSLQGFNNLTSLNLDDMSRNSPYLVTSQEGNALKTKYYPCCSEPYMSMEYNFTVQSAKDVPNSKESYFQTEVPEWSIEELAQAHSG